MKLSDEDLRKEISLYTQYLIGKQPTPKVVELYLAAICRRDLEFENRTITIVSRCLQYPWLIGWFDAATGMFDRENEWRKRLILAFAVIETQPEYLAVFKPQVFTVSDTAHLLLKGIGSICRAIVGKFVLWTM